MEDDSSFAGPGYMNDKDWGKLSYNILTNKYNQLK